MPRCPSVKNTNIKTYLVTPKYINQDSPIVSCMPPTKYRRIFYSYAVGSEPCNLRRRQLETSIGLDDASGNRNLADLENDTKIDTRSTTITLYDPTTWGGVETGGITYIMMIKSLINGQWYNPFEGYSPPAISRKGGIDIPHNRGANGCDTKPYLEDMFMMNNTPEGLLKPIMIWRPIAPRHYVAMGDVYSYYDEAPETEPIPDDNFIDKLIKPRTGEFAPMMCIHNSLINNTGQLGDNDKLWETQEAVFNNPNINQTAADTNFYKSDYNLLRVKNNNNQTEENMAIKSLILRYSDTDKNYFDLKKDNNTNINDHIKNNFYAEKKRLLFNDSTLSKENKKLFSMSSKWYGHPEKNKYWDVDDLQKYSILEFIGVIREGIINHQKTNLNFWIIHRSGYTPDKIEDDQNTSIYNSFNIIDTHKGKILKINGPSITFENAFDGDGKLISTESIPDSENYEFSINMTRRDIRERNGNFRIIPRVDLNSQSPKYLKISDPRSPNPYAGDLEGHFRYSLSQGNRNDNDTIFTNFISPYGSNLLKILPNIELDNDNINKTYLSHKENKIKVKLTYKK